MISYFFFLSGGHAPASRFIIWLYAIILWILVTIHTVPFPLGLYNKKPQLFTAGVSASCVSVAYYVLFVCAHPSDTAELVFCGWQLVC